MAQAHTRFAVISISRGFRHLALAAFRAIVLRRFGVCLRTRNFTISRAFFAFIGWMLASACIGFRYFLVTILSSTFRKPFVSSARITTTPSAPWIGPNDA